MILNADVSGTERARNLNLLREPELAADAAAEFRQAAGAGPVLTSVGVHEKDVGFATNIGDPNIGQLGFGMPATEIFTRDLNGLQRQLGKNRRQCETGKPSPVPFTSMT